MGIGIVEFNLSIPSCTFHIFTFTSVLLQSS